MMNICHYTIHQKEVWSIIKFLNIFNFIYMWIFFAENVYDATLKSVKESFPQYIRELEGVADGADVEFHKVDWTNYHILIE